MNPTLKMTLFWLIAIVITLSAAVYQRLTGPTHPKRIELVTSKGSYPIRLLRSHGGNDDCRIRFTVPDKQLKGIVQYRRYPSAEEWTTMDMVRVGDQLVASLPHQPPAGKLEYKVVFNENGQTYSPQGNHTIIRFKGAVPDWVLIPHVLIMFLAMLLSNLSGILAIARHPKMMYYSWFTFVLILIGGMFFGPVMQKYAFGEFWTGFPHGTDLTDNKTLIAFIFWIVALIANLKKRRPAWIIIASVVMLSIYLIPHSMFGSELNYDTGQVVTGE